jgi:Zn-dependent protease with chaperone function
MIEIPALYYDGKTAAQFTVTCRFYETGILEIQGQNFTFKYSLADARISPRIGNTCRSLYFKNGAKLESFANDELDVVAKYFNQNPYQALVHKLEKHLHFALASLVITALLIWAGIEYGVPLLAKSAAYAVPYSLEKKIGVQGLASLDDVLLQPSRLKKDRQQQLTKKFAQAFDKLPRYAHYQLNFRNSSQLGANALAFPGGVLIITDELIKLADNDEQIIAVLAHEIGHVEYRHGLRSLFQNSFSALLMAGLLGDISSISSLSVTLPTVLVQTRYSRQFELEADDYALAFLAAHHIKPQALTTLLSRLEPKDNKNTDLSAFDYLSSHPNTQERIERANQSAL